MKILIKNTIVKEFGIRIRLVEYEPDKKEVWQETDLSNISKEPYWVEFVPLQFGIPTPHDEWGVFGGGPGMLDSALRDLEYMQLNDIFILELVSQ